MLLFETRLLLLPPATVLVLNKTVPPAAPTAAVDDPRMAQRVSVSLDAPLMSEWCWCRQ
jgi:hypothetical protein